MDFLKRFDIKVKNVDLYNTAITHSSYTNEHKGTKNYERLEFLGDAVLELVTSEYFYLNTDFKEGDMTRLRASYVCELALATYAIEIGLDKEIKVGVGQTNRVNNTIIADVFEAVIGAIYLDSGYEDARRFIRSIFIPYVEKKVDFIMDYKTLLQEYVQTDRKSLDYELINEYGLCHDKTFEVVVKIDNIIYGKGIGKSKKEAEQKAAYDAYIKSAR